MILNFTQFISEKKDTPKPKGAPDWHDSDAPDAEGRFRDLSPKDLAAWLIKTRKGDMKRISGSITQQIVFNRKEDPEYAKKMEKTRTEVYKQLGREDLMESIFEKEINEITLSYAGAKEILKDLKEDPDLLDHLGFGSFKDAVRYIKEVGMDLWYELRGEIEDYKKMKK